MNDSTKPGGTAPDDPSDQSARPKWKVRLIEAVIGASLLLIGALAAYGADWLNFHRPSSEAERARAATATTLTSPTTVTKPPTTTDPPPTTSPKAAACSALRKAASKEKQDLTRLRGLFVEQGETVRRKSSMTTYTAAYNDALSAVQAANETLGPYRDAKLSLPQDFKFADDLGVITDDLQRLDAGVRSGNIPYAPWNQLYDYAADAGEVASMRCPT